MRPWAAALLTLAGMVASAALGYALGVHRTHADNDRRNAEHDRHVAATVEEERQQAEETAERARDIGFAEGRAYGHAEHHNCHPTCLATDIRWKAQVVTCKPELN
jgi:hypothetical protein